MTTQGIVYACSHRDWIPETIRSAQSFAQHMPDIERHFFAPPALIEQFRAQLEPAFSKIIPLELLHFAHRPRFEAMSRAEFDRAIFIDGDTLLLMPVYELFDVLSQFDIAAAIAPQLFHPEAVRSRLYDALPKVSMAVPEWNTGVLVVRQSKAIQAFLENWRRLFDQSIRQGFKMDQPSFRSAIAASGLRIATLANLYNIRANVEQTIRGLVRILHAHGDLPAIARDINASPALRYYAPDKRLIDGFRPKAES